MWQKLQGEAPLVKIEEGSLRVTWNDAAHTLMGKPDAVGIFYDAATSRLGFRFKHWRDQEDLSEFAAVYHKDAGEFEVKAKEHLQGAGISVEDDLELSLNVPAVPPEGEQTPDDIGIFWVQLP